jgi:hypothetical protein
MKIEVEVLINQRTTLNFCVASTNFGARIEKGERERERE